MSLTSKRGRPKGSRTKERPATDVVASRCGACHSTERTNYGSVREVQGQGVAPDGKPYNAVKLSNTTCLSCGQARVDRVYMLRK